MKQIYSQYKILAPATAVAVVLAASLAVMLAIKPERTQQQPATAQHQSTPAAEAEPIASDELRGLIAERISQQPAAMRDSLTYIYDKYSYGPLWSGGKRAARRIEGLQHAAAMAEAQAIDVSDLSTHLQLAATPSLNAAAIDVALTAEALQLATALRTGAVPRKELGESWLMREETFDPLPGLTAALEKTDLAAYFETLAPADRQYQALAAALQTYRRIAMAGGWPILSGNEEILLDKDDARIAVLRERLIAEGYLAANSGTDAAQLAESIRAFQSRNGLTPDGRVGRGTLAALQISADERVAQIAANLERHRHTPRDLGKDYIAVNTAATHLDIMRGGESTLRLRIIAGDRRHATPILSATVTGVTFNPRWDIPPSIARKEILPKLKKNPNYLADNNMVIVDGYEGDPSGQYHDWAQYSGQSFPLRLRQRAGSGNSLGRIKLQMSNQHNIYLHDTPSRKLFAREDRYLSHGCVRVDQPEELARHVLLDTPQWDADAIVAAIAAGTTRTVGLKTSLPVYLFYWTAFAEDGALHFRNDVYSRDKVLAEKLGVQPAEQHQFSAQQ